MKQFDHKKENLPYTIGIIKPNTSQSLDKINQIVDRIEREGFILKEILKKVLSRQEIQNVFYKQQNETHYREIEKYMQSGESVILLLCHETEDPIRKWKKMIGLKDPIECKKQDPECLRSVYGENMIRNELHGSDCIYDANKERDSFSINIPQKQPDFKYDNFKLDYDKIMKWLYPVNQEHPNINQRLDLLALYGPVINNHSVDKCYCVKCSRICKEYLQNMKEQKVKEEQMKSGQQKVYLAPLRLIDEIGQQKLSSQLCDKCNRHQDNYIHLGSGRLGLHLMTDLEIKQLGEQVNHDELLDLLRIEKGKAADIMIQTINTKQNQMLEHDQNTIKALMSQLDTDYYGRYDFNALQNVILEDRRIRMVKWVSMIVEKPVDRFSNPKMFNKTISQTQRNDPNSIHFTIRRTLPLKMTIKPVKPSHVAIDLEPSIMDYKKLMLNQVREAKSKRTHKYFHNALNIQDASQLKDTQHFNLLRNYNEGRHGDWNNYVCLKGQQKGSYVNHQNYTDQSRIQL